MTLHEGEPLSLAQAEALEGGTDVVVTWSGGTGPWHYVVRRINDSVVFFDRNGVGIGRPSEAAKITLTSAPPTRGRT
jgi:hypothetical protein